MAVKLSLRVSSDPKLGLGSNIVQMDGTEDYRHLTHKPSIEEVELVGDRKLSDFGMGIVTNEAILGLFR